MNCEIMECDSFVDFVDSLITKMTKMSARVEFVETSGQRGPSGEHLSYSLKRDDLLPVRHSFWLAPSPGSSEKRPESPSEAEQKPK